MTPAVDLYGPGRMAGFAIRTVNDNPQSKTITGRAGFTYSHVTDRIPGEVALAAPRAVDVFGRQVLNRQTQNLVDAPAGGGRTRGMSQCRCEGRGPSPSGPPARTARAGKLRLDAGYLRSLGQCRLTVLSHSTRLRLVTWLSTRSDS